MSYLNFKANRNVPQPTVKKKNSEGYLTLPVLLGMLKNVLDNDVIAATPVVSTKLRGLINEITKDRNLAQRILEVTKATNTSSELKKFNKDVAKLITTIAKTPIWSVIEMMTTKDTHVPLSHNQYEAIVELSRTVYLFCPTKAWEGKYREEIKDFDMYLEWNHIVLLSSKEMPTFLKIPSIGYIYSPKGIESSDLNRQKQLHSIAEVQEVLDKDKASINLV